jgi:hypothetical protein
MDTDQPLMFKLASKGLPDPTELPRDNPAIEDPNLAADREAAIYISETLKSTELASGREVSADDIQNLILEKFPGMNSQIIRLATDILLNDAANFKSRVAGNHTGFKLLISSRNPIACDSNKNSLTGQIAKQPQTVTAQQQQKIPPINQQKQPQQPQQQQQNNIQLTPELQQRIQALSTDDQAALEQAAVGVVRDILPSLSAANPIDELMLENNIATKYNVSSEVADILVDVLLLYPQYKAFITPQQNQNKNLNQNTQSPSGNSSATTTTIESKRQQ